MTYSPLIGFSNQTRIQLITCLSNGKKNVNELIENCGLSQSAVSQHLQKLRISGLVKDEKMGKYVYYSLINPKSAKIAMMLKDFLKEQN